MSLTVPVIVPCDDCPNACADRRNRNKKRRDDNCGLGRLMDILTSINDR
jgi:hypothetical protein